VTQILNTGLVFDLIHVMGVISWSLPIFALTVLAYAIEYYTKFKTYWKLLLIASLAALVNSFFISYKYWTLADVGISQILAVDLLLLSGTILAGYASIKLLKFQSLTLGKTNHTIKILGFLAIAIPLLLYLSDGMSTSTLLDSIAYNLAIVFLILVFLTLAKITKIYIPRYKSLAYSSARLGSIILLLDPIQRNYAAFFGMGVTTKQIAGGMTILTHIAADILLLPSLFLILLEAKARGVHLIPGVEEEDSETPLQYRLKKGYTYLVREHSIEKSLNLLKDYVTHGYHGLCVTRAQPSSIRDDYGLYTTPILWMTKSKTDEKTIKPGNLKRLQAIIEDFIRNDGDFILLQRLDYLITQTDFDSVLAFVQDVGDKVATSDTILVVGVDTSTLTRRQQALMLQELNEVEMEQQTVLSEPLYDIVKYVHSENKRHRSPNIKAVTQEFDITKTTARKRIYELESMGLINLVKEGRSKLLELTDEGYKVIKSPVGPKER